MELKVNGNHVDITLEGEKTVGEILKAFEEEASKNKAATIGIKLNGNEIPPEKFEDAVKESINDSTLLELTVLSQNQIIDSFKTCKTGLESLINQMEQIPVLLQSNKDSDVNFIIQNLANEIDNFCHTSTLSALFPEIYNKILIDGKEMSSFFEDFAPVLKDFEDALASKDSVTVGDLAEYEISPRLTLISNSIDTIIK